MNAAFKKLEEARQVLKPFSKKTKQELILELNNEFNGNLTQMADNYNRTIDELLNAMKTHEKTNEMKNKESIIAKIAKRKRVNPKNINNLHADACNYFFSYKNINGKFVRHGMCSFEEIGEKPKY